MGGRIWAIGPFSTISNGELLRSSALLQLHGRPHLGDWPFGKIKTQEVKQNLLCSL